MFMFGKVSRRRLDTCTDQLVELMEYAIADKSCPFDFTIICGERTKKEQTAAFSSGYSTVQFPDSYHNRKPSEAVDVARFYRSNPHIRWDNIEDFEILIKHIKKCAKKLKINIECGADWTTFKDYPHIQITRVEAPDEQCDSIDSV